MLLIVRKILCVGLMSFVTVITTQQAYSDDTACEQVRVTVKNRGKFTWYYDDSYSEEHLDSSPTHKLEPGEKDQYKVGRDHDKKLESHLHYYTKNPHREVVFYVERDKLKSGHYTMGVSADVEDGHKYAQEMDVRHSHCDDPDEVSDHIYHGEAVFQFLEPATKTVTVTIQFASEQQQRLATQKALAGIKQDYFDDMDNVDGKPYDVEVDQDDPKKATYKFYLNDKYDSGTTHQS